MSKRMKLRILFHRLLIAISTPKNRMKFFPFRKELNLIHNADNSRKKELIFIKTRVLRTKKSMKVEFLKKVYLPFKENLKATNWKELSWISPLPHKIILKLWLIPITSTPRKNNPGNLWTSQLHLTKKIYNRL